MTLSESAGITCECIPDIAAGFGGGMKIQSVCGAVTGVIMAIGLKYGKNPTKVREAVIEFLRTFQKVHGTISCRKLLGVDVTTKKGIKEYKKRNLHSQCEHFVSTAVEVAETLLSSE
jgi:C_GCAxxG_C_C family probable redox protein